MIHLHQSVTITPDGASPAGRRLLLENGYEPVLLCGKRPLLKGWNKARMTVEMLSRIESQYPYHTNTGVKTGHLAVVDIDVRIPAHVSAVADAVVAVLGCNEVVRVGSKGKVICYHNSIPIPKITVTGICEGTDRRGNLVEFLGTGQQVAAYGIHPDTGKPYDWPNAFWNDDLLGTPLDKLPSVSPAMLREAARAVQMTLTGLGYRDVTVRGLEERQHEAGSRNGEPVPVEWLMDALKVIPPLHRDDWRSILWAVKDANLVPGMDDEERIDLLNQWSSGELGGMEPPDGYEGYDDVACTYDWAKGSDNPVTVGTIYKIAKENGYEGGPPCVSLMAMAAATGTLFANDNLVDSVESSVGDETPRENRWSKLTLQGEEIFNMPPATMLIPGWLRDIGSTFILAERGTGKTVLAVDAALCMATGNDWMREPVTQGFHAVYLAGEDVENTAQHVAAWCKHHNGGKVPERFRFVRDVPDLMDGEDCTALVSHLRSRLPEGARAVLVLDTWQRATSAAPDGQNSDRDMGVAVKRVEALARAFGGPVICCCHPPKHDKGTVAGSLVIENTSTAIWHLSKTDAGLEVKVIRIKGQGLGNHKLIDHKTVMLDRCDERGQRLTGLVATFAGGDWSNAADAREAENAARQAVLNTVLDLLDRGISVVRVSGGGQKPRDVAAAVKKLGHNLTARQVSDHLAALERDGKLVYVQADKNHRGKAGYQRPSVAALAAESSAESPPKAIPNGAESD